MGAMSEALTKKYDGDTRDYDTVMRDKVGTAVSTMERQQPKVVDKEFPSPHDSSRGKLANWVREFPEIFGRFYTNRTKAYGKKHYSANFYLSILRESIQKHKNQSPQNADADKSIEEINKLIQKLDNPKTKLDSQFYDEVKSIIISGWKELPPELKIELLKEKPSRSFVDSLILLRAHFNKIGLERFQLWWKCIPGSIRSGDLAYFLTGNFEGFVSEDEFSKLSDGSFLSDKAKSLVDTCRHMYFRILWIEEVLSVRQYLMSNLWNISQDYEYKKGMVLNSPSLDTSLADSGAIALKFNFADDDSPSEIKHGCVICINSISSNDDGCKDKIINFVQENDIDYPDRGGKSHVGQCFLTKTAPAGITVLSSFVPEKPGLAPNKFLVKGNYTALRNQTETFANLVYSQNRIFVDRISKKHPD